MIVYFDAENYSLLISLWTCQWYGLQSTNIFHHFFKKKLKKDRGLFLVSEIRKQKENNDVAGV